LLTLHLHDLKFFAFHGVHEEERLCGNHFLVNVELTWNDPPKIITALEETIDYVSVYNIIATRMKLPTALLETVAMEIGSTIYNTYGFVSGISVKVLKLHPAVVGMQGALGVSWVRNFH
jgi:dihydroneopterin aldolase